MDLKRGYRLSAGYTIAFAIVQVLLIAMIVRGPDALSAALVALGGVLLWQRLR